jgi:hypothetical protein
MILIHYNWNIFVVRSFYFVDYMMTLLKIKTTTHKNTKIESFCIIYYNFFSFKFSSCVPKYLPNLNT